MSLFALALAFFSFHAHANEASIDALIAQMTLEEKVGMLGGVNSMETRPLPRLGIPAIKMTDGPLGVNLGRSTAFPSGVSMGATFNPELAHAFAVGIAEEARFKGRNMLLGPCVNISRNPFGGRNFESYGEDPYLMSRLAEKYVAGIQSRGLLASVKHLAANDQEFERMTINANVSVRALFEIHLPAFEAAVRAGTWTVMSAYNKINGHYASENNFLQNVVLKQMWGFRGFVVSDWGATHSVVEAANGGLDLEMPAGVHFNEQLIAAVRGGAVAEYTINDKVRRILRAMHGIGLMGIAPPALPPALGPGSHEELALRIAQESLVLLKNTGNALPLSQQMKKIALIGPNADRARSGGGGSSQVPPYREISALEGMRSRLAPEVSIQFARGLSQPNDRPSPVPAELLRPSLDSTESGLRADYFANMTLSGKPVLSRVEKNVDFASDIPQQQMSIRWTGFVRAPSTGRFRFTTMSDDGVRLYVNNKLVIDRWDDHGPTTDDAEVLMEAGTWVPLRLEYFQNGGGATIAFGFQSTIAGTDLQDAIAAAQGADAAVVFAGLGSFMEGEGQDRTSLELPPGQVELIEAVAAVNPRTIVVLTSGNPLNLQPWLSKVQAVLHTWYPGQEGGYAIADVLLGNVSPSGKLPITFLKRWEDSPAYGNYPGSNGQVNYEEGVFVGYRHFDAKNIEPEFPFGFGLSYTEFEFADLRVKVLDASAANPRVKVSFEVINAGGVSGAEVAQLYVGEVNPGLPRPPRELKGFQKVWLSGEALQKVEFMLDKSSFAYFDESSMTWKVKPGTFTISVGNSSRNLPLRATVKLE